MTTAVDVNLLWLISGRVGGSEEYTVGLLDALADVVDASVRVRLFTQPGLSRVHPSLAEAYDIVELPRRVSAKPMRFGLESSWLAVQTRHADLVHHGGGVLPYGGRGRSVVTVHDLQPLDLPENFTPAQRHWFRRMLPRVARSADRVICPSMFTRERIVALLGVDRSCIDIVSPVHLPRPARVASSTASPFGRYVLLPAMAHPHKRHVDAIEALDHLRGRHPELNLVFTGAPGTASDAIENSRRRLALQARVHVLGRVDASELEDLMHGAAAMVFPSLYEGFGNPVLEAMAVGTPVIAADATALPEVAGGAALLVPPADPLALSEAIDRLLTEPELVEELRRNGRRRVEDFNPEVAGRQLLDAYRDALS
jgi:glycosyltransferase involved in cell wall biosynthesis